MGLSFFVGLSVIFGQRYQNFVGLSFEVLPTNNLKVIADEITVSSAIVLFICRSGQQLFISKNLEKTGGGSENSVGTAGIRHFLLCEALHRYV